MAVKELTGFILILALLWVVWFFVGNPSSNTNTQTTTNEYSDVQYSE